MMVFYLFYRYWEFSARWSASEFAKAVNDNKAAQRQLELQYNRVIESHGVYLALYTRG